MSIDVRSMRISAFIVGMKRMKATVKSRTVTYNWFKFLKYFITWNRIIFSNDQSRNSHPDIVVHEKSCFSSKLIGYVGTIIIGLRK